MSLSPDSRALIDALEPYAAVPRAQLEAAMLRVEKRIGKIGVAREVKAIRSAGLIRNFGAVARGNIYFQVLRSLFSAGARKAEKVAVRKTVLHKASQYARVRASQIAARGISDLHKDISTGVAKAAGEVKPVITIDSTRFNRALKSYMQHSKKALSDICNEKAFWIALNAFGFTTAVDKAKLKAELQAPSRVAPNVPLAAILLNKRKANTGATGLQGKQMKSAVTKFIRARQAATQFLRAGWIPAIQRFAAATGKKSKSKPRGQPKGGAKPALNTGWSPIASLWNSVKGGETAKAEVQDILTTAVQKAVNKEAASMEAYVAKKLEQAATKAGMR